MPTIRFLPPVLLATACSLPPLEEQALDGACPDGQVVRVSTGEVFGSVDEALSMAHSEDHFCLGAGEHAVGSVTLQREARMYSPQAVVLEGAGMDRTTLVGTGADALLYVDLAGSFSLSGVTVEAARVRLRANDLDVRDVEFTGYSGWERGLTLKGDRVTVDHLVVVDNQLDYASGLYLAATEASTLSRFVLSDNTSMAGYVAEIHGPITWSQSEITRNAFSVETPGYDLVELYGPSVLDQVSITKNDFNGPALRTYDTLHAVGLEIEGNQSNYHAVVSLGADATLEDSVIANNEGLDGAVGLYGEGRATFVAVDLGTGNVPCDISAEGSCLDDPFTGEATGTCDEKGCL